MMKLDAVARSTYLYGMRCYASHLRLPERGLRLLHRELIVASGSEGNRAGGCLEAEISRPHSSKMTGIEINLMTRAVSALR
jgi:hypothetical protein